VCGTSGLYYGFFTCMFAAFAGTVWSIGKRTWSPLLFALLTSVLTVVLLAVTGLGIDGLLDLLTGSINAVRRLPTEQIMYGLRMPDVAGVIGSIPGLRPLLDEYRGLVQHTGEGRFEFPGPVLTLIILASPLLLAALGASQPADDESERRWRTNAFMACACIVFGVFYAVPGGIGYVFGVFVFSAIRATQRIIPFLTFFALVAILSLVEMVLRSSRSRVARLAVGVLIVALLVGMLPMLRAAPGGRAVIVREPAIKANVASIHDLLRAKNLNGVTAVLQLPHVAWPEQPPIRGFDPYNHWHGFIYDSYPSRTRWSYGSHLSQGAFRTLKSAVDAHREAGLVGAAAALEFDAILVEKSAYDAGELKSLRANIERDIAPACVIYEDTIRILYLIARQAGDQSCTARP
jgi:hypothetical protein